MKVKPHRPTADVKNDLIRTVALACYSYDAESIDPQLADQAWELAIEHAAKQGITPAEAQRRLWLKQTMARHCIHVH